MGKDNHPSPRNPGSPKQDKPKAKHPKTHINQINKDQTERKKSQYIMNNAVNEIKNTLEGTNSRIMEAEDRISEVEDRMVEINESERKKEK